MNRTNLQEIEQRIYEDRTKDGLFELVIGVFLLAAGVTLITRFMMLMGFIAAFPVIVLRELRRRIVDPRLGTIMPGEKQARKERGLKSATAILVALLLLIGMTVFWIVTRTGLGVNTREFFQIIGLDLFFLMMVGIFLMVGWMQGYRGLLRYLVAAVVLIAVRLLLNLPEYTYFILLGLIMTVIGVLSLSRFLRLNPRLTVAEGQPHEE